MRQSIKEFVELVSKNLPVIGPIYEFGALQAPTQVGFADLRPSFPGIEYVGCDMQEGPGVDLILDLHSIALPSESVGTVVMLETLEHVEFPRKAMEELHRILRPGGMLVVSSVLNFPIHEYPSDYWRFTPEGLGSLLGSFTGVWVESVGFPDFPHTVVGIGFKGSGAVPEEFERRSKAWKKRWRSERVFPLKRTLYLLMPASVAYGYSAAKRAIKRLLGRR